jgi:protoporphyrin/coproporphyrin ferrochelatase
MPFQPEPPYSHGQAARTAVVLCNLGTPDEATAPALRRYLAEFLGDGRVVEIPKAIWALILHGIILRVRPAKSAAKYASIWTPEGSPLKVWTEKQATLLRGYLGERGHQVTVRYAMRYGNPSIPAARRAQGAGRDPHPHPAGLPAVQRHHHRQRVRRGGAGGLKARTCPNCASSTATTTTRATSRRWPNASSTTGCTTAGRHLVMSFHGVPERTLHAGRPLPLRMPQDRAPAGRAPGPGQGPLHRDLPVALWQGQVAGTLHRAHPGGQGAGRAQERRRGLPRLHQRLPGNAGRNPHGGARGLQHAGGEEFQYIDCLNDSPDWIRAMADLAERHLQGWPTRQADNPMDLQDSRARALAMGAKD